MCNLYLRRTIILLFLLICKPAFAEPVYLWIKKADDVDMVKGDVLAITPATPQYEPTVSELVNVYVVKVDLTKNEQDALMKCGEKEDGGVIYEDSTSPREKKIDVDKLNVKESKQEFTKNEINSKIITKSASVITP